MTVVVVAAHPDDEILGAGGTFARLVQTGEDVHAIIMAEGASSRYPAEMAQTLEKSAQRAAEQLGFAGLSFGPFADQRLDVEPLVDVTQYIQAILAPLRPRAVFTHFPGDANADHTVVARAAWTACRPYAASWLRRFAVFETPSSTEWGWSMPGNGFKPTLYVDITGTLETKLAAMACYESELREYPHPRSLRALRERAAFWGSHVGVAYAEPFRVFREVE
jgi:LmbE family N-acetylglucosaminyl deacetylase